MTPMSDDEERLIQKGYALTSAEPSFRERLRPLHASHDTWNALYFNGALLPPHLGFGKPPSRSLAVCRATTDYGGKVQMTLHERLVFGCEPPWLVRPWPAPGVCRLVEDLLLRLVVRQWVIENRGTLDEGSYGDYGPLFCDRANQIGFHLGLAPVACRRRLLDAKDIPLAAFWPCCLRDEGYYGDDITPRLLQRATGRKLTGRRTPAPDNLGFYEYILRLLSTHPPRAQEVLRSHIDRLQELRRVRRPLLHSVESGRTEPDGSPLNVADVEFEPAWLSWDNSIVSKMLQTIDAFRAFGELPILADAMEDAGCRDGRILRHLRARGEHTRSCWVLRGLREASASRSD